MQVNIKNLIDDVQCYQTVRELRWPDGVACPSCQTTQIIKRGKALLHALSSYWSHKTLGRCFSAVDSVIIGSAQIRSG